MLPTLLVVDDENVVATAIQRHLANAYVIDVESSGSRALTRCRHTSPDCVLVNLNLPDMDGIEFVLSLRRMGLSLPIVVMPGLSRIWMREPHLLDEDLVQGSLHKPLEVEHLRQVLKRVLERRSP